MTRDDAKILWPIIKAWSEGKTLQFHDKGAGKWLDTKGHNRVCFDDFQPDRYRIKPEPVEYIAALDAQNNVVGIERSSKSVGDVIRIYLSPGLVARTVTLREVQED